MEELSDLWKEYLERVEVFVAAERSLSGARCMAAFTPVNPRLIRNPAEWAAEIALRTTLLQEAERGRIAAFKAAVHETVHADHG